jgi:hypothetical protein
VETGNHAALRAQSIFLSQGSGSPVLGDGVQPYCSKRRWCLTSAAMVDAAADQRSAGWVCWRGNAEGLGGFTYVNRLSLTTLQPTGMGFFGLVGSTAALAATSTLSAVANASQKQSDHPS